jgi:hypothetical protein
MGSIIKVENASGKEYLHLDTDLLSSSSQNSKSGNGGSGGLSIGTFNLGVSANLAEEKSTEWKNAGKSLNEQVK